MPLLGRETELHPGNLFESTEPGGQWWVAYVRSRQEKALARHLLDRQVPYYLPMWEKRRRRSGRALISFLPLFPGYVFFQGWRRERRQALESNVVVKILDVKDQLRLHRELASLFLLRANGAPLVPYPYIGEGDQVEVAAGPFRGWTGSVVRQRGHFRLVVSVTLLRRSVAAEFDRDVLVPAPRNGRSDRATA